MVRVTFLGAAGTVTGSKYLIEMVGRQLLVDCGLFQGEKELRLLNWEAPTFSPEAIDTIFLTHGHLDHSGYLPRLVKLGFRGKILATPPTIKVAEVILKDSAKIQQEEAARANKEHYSKHNPALPLYDLEDVAETLKRFVPVEEGVWFKSGDELNVRFQYNGHILGSCFIEIEVEGKRIVFSGDIGRQEDLLLYPPKKPKRADLLVTESTYGGRLHPSFDEVVPELTKVINDTLSRGGSLFIPSFAVERTQLLMFILWKLKKEKAIRTSPMIMDSPMGADILDLFRSAKNWHRLSLYECEAFAQLFHITSTFQETLKMRESKEPKIVIAGSGMLTGGRMLSYLETHAANPQDTLLFVGFQAEGTRGRKILEGADEIKLYGKTLPFNMQVHQIEGLSAHADEDGLINWTSELEMAPSHLFITHGEQEAAQALKKRYADERGWQATIAALHDSVLL